MSARLRHTAHPLQLRAIKVVRAGYLGIRRVDALLAFLQIVAIIPFVGIDLFVVDFQDFRADAIQKVAVVRDHQQAQCTLLQIFLQPFGHVKVQMVSRLIQHQKVRLIDKHIGQSHPFQLSSRKLSHRLAEMADIQLRKDLFGFAFVVPGIGMVHAQEQIVQSRIARCLQTMFILSNQIHRLIPVIETGFQHCQFFRIGRRLLQIAHFQVTPENDVPGIVPVFSSQDIE